MKITVDVDEALWKHASKLTGVTDKHMLAQMGLDLLIARGSAKRLAELGGTERQLRPIPRRKT